MAATAVAQGVGGGKRLDAVAEPSLKAFLYTMKITKMNINKCILMGWMLGVVWGCSNVANAQTQTQTSAVWQDWRDDVMATRWETGAIVAGVTGLGAYSWDWGSSTRFKFNPEGWFGEKTGSGGADKLGHAFTSYALTNVLTDQLVRKGRPLERAALSAALTTQAIMLYVEVFDGYSKDHGFAREDLVMNLIGTSFSYARTVTPGLRDRLDFRMEYEKSGYRGFRPLSDYEGQKYLLALKLGGFESLRQTPLRYLELQAGYYAQGFSKAARDSGLDRSRHTFIGIGVSLNELFFGQRSSQENALRYAGRLFFEHIQVPHTAAKAVQGQ